MDGRAKTSGTRDSPVQRAKCRSSRQYSVGRLALSFLLAASVLQALNAYGRHADVTDSGIPRPVVTVLVYDYVHLRPDVLAGSEETAGTILKQAGIETVWRDCPVSSADFERYPACHKPGTIAFVLRILPQSMARKLHRINEPLGFVLPCQDTASACPVTIFYYRVADLAHGHTRAERILGHVISHELGHVLLDSNSHTLTGIMRGVWSPEDLMRMAWSYLFFTPDQARQLNAGILRRSRQAAVPLCDVVRAVGGRIIIADQDATSSCDCCTDTSKVVSGRLKSSGLEAQVRSLRKRLPIESVNVCGAGIAQR